MPRSYAQRLAAYLLEHADQSPMLVEVPNHGYNEKVVEALQELGCRVERQTENRFLVYAPEPNGEHPA